MSPKTAIVTGAGSGIGLATSTALLSAGWQVVLVDVHEIKPDVVAPYEGRHLVLRADVSSADDVRSAVSMASERFGRLDALVNSAAITLSADGDIRSVEDDVFERVLAVNLRGTFLMCKYALPALIETGGAIVNLSSAAAAMGLTSTAYPASRAV